MNRSTAIRSFVWKEFRQDLPIWLFVLTIGSGLLYLVRFHTGAAIAVHAIGITMASISALAACVLAFAMEYDNETNSFLQTISVPSRLSFWTTVIFIGVTNLVLATFGWLLAAVLAEEPFDLSLQLDVILNGFFQLVEIIGWSVLLGIWIRKPVPTALLAAAIVWPVGTLWTFVPGGQSPIAWVTRAAIIVALYVLMNRRSADWLEPARGSDRAKATNVHTSKPAPMPWGFVSLVWQTAIDARGSMWAIVAFAIVFSAAAIIIPFVPIVLTGLFGVGSFVADQQGHRYRFLAEQGARPRFVWLARLSVWLPCAVLWLLLIHFVVPRESRFAAFYSPLPDNWGSKISWGQVLIAGTYCFAAGQVCALLTSSVVLALAAYLCVTILAYVWLCIAFAAEMPISLTMLPLAIGAFAGIWKATPRWLSGRAYRWHLFVPIAILGVVAYVAVGVYRISQIPDVGDAVLHEFESPHPLRDDDLQAGRQLLQSARAVAARPPAECANDQEFIREVLAAVHVPRWSVSYDSNDATEIADLGHQLVVIARLLIDQKQPQLALDILLGVRHLALSAEPPARHALHARFQYYISAGRAAQDLRGVDDEFDANDQVPYGMSATSNRDVEPSPAKEPDGHRQQASQVVAATSGQADRLYLAVQVDKYRATRQMLQQAFWGTLDSGPSDLPIGMLAYLRVFPFEYIRSQRMLKYDLASEHTKQQLDTWHHRDPWRALLHE